MNNLKGDGIAKQKIFFDKELFGLRLAQCYAARGINVSSLLPELGLPDDIRLRNAFIAKYGSEKLDDEEAISSFIIKKLLKLFGSYSLISEMVLSK